MDEKNYKITLADGRMIDNLKLNGNNFISKTPIDEAMFINNCSPVIISDGSNEENHPSMELVQVTENGGEYWFVLREFSSEELTQMKIQSDIEYVAMMAGVEL